MDSPLFVRFSLRRELKGIGVNPHGFFTAEAAGGQRALLYLRETLKP
jgi:hypothetical protein